MDDHIEPDGQEWSMMEPRLFGISDIHGHHAEMMDLYQQLLDAGMDPNRDTLVFLGDVVDGGPHTKQVIDQLIAWSEQYPHWGFLKGNHEQMMLDALVYRPNDPGAWFHWWNQGGKATAYSYLPENASDYERAIMQSQDAIDLRHLSWLQSRPLRHAHERYHFVHAGFRPAVPLADQAEEDMLWIREEFFMQRYSFGKPVVFGHTPVPEPMIVYDYRAGHQSEIVAIGIDTMVGDYGKLTAVELTGDTPIFFHAESTKGNFDQFRGF